MVMLRYDVPALENARVGWSTAEDGIRCLEWVYLYELNADEDVAGIKASESEE